MRRNRRTRKDWNRNTIIRKHFQQESDVQILKRKSLQSAEYVTNVKGS